MFQTDFPAIVALFSVSYFIMHFYIPHIYRRHCCAQLKSATCGNPTYTCVLRKYGLIRACELDSWNSSHLGLHHEDEKTKLLAKIHGKPDARLEEQKCQKL